MKKLFFLILSMLIAVPATLQADILPGLSLSGSGEVRYLGFIKVYDAKLYVQDTTEANEILSDNKSKCLKIQYHVDLSASDIIRAADKVLDNQHQQEVITRFRQELDTLHQSYNDVNDGDTYTMCYNAAREETVLSYNTVPVTTIPSAGFGQLYLGIWLGDENPLDSDLKEQLLAGVGGD